MQPLYRVRFLQRDIWPHLAEEEGPDSTSVTVDVEIYENWLVAAPQGHLNEPPPPIATGAHHVGQHDHHSHGHSHLSRPELEQKAVSDEAAPSLGEQVNEPTLSSLLSK